jgi:hypothetical protein
MKSDYTGGIVMFIIMFGIAAVQLYILKSMKAFRGRDMGYGGGRGFDPYMHEPSPCYSECEVARNEMACTQCQLGPEDSACYAECNIARNDVACNDCLYNLPYTPAWLGQETGHHEHGRKRHHDEQWEFY